MLRDACSVHIQRFTLYGLLDQPDRSLCRITGVAHQHRDRHRADAAGRWRDRAGDFFRLLEIDITHLTETALLGRVRNCVGADVNHRRARFDPVGFDELRFADCRDDDVGLPHDVGQVLRFRVADRHGRVAVDEQERGRQAHEIRKMFQSSCFREIRKEH